jgi:4-hydroxy-tetrahydrodipicolinate reductase
MIRVGVFGAGGRMGTTVCRAVAGDPALDLAAAVDPHHVGLDLRQVTGVESGLLIEGDATALKRSNVDVAVDFTVASAARENLLWCAKNGVHAIVGTTGFSEDDYDEFGKVFTSSNCVIAPNFAIGAVLMMRFAELAAPYFDTAEIIELHHDAKIDAPSGTARATADRMAAASSDWAPDPTRDEVLPGARGGKGAGGIPIHAVRMRGLFAHQEVVMGTTGQSLTVRHDTYDRDCYMPGVLLAIKQVADRPGLTLGLEPLLNL